MGSRWLLRLTFGAVALLFAGLTAGAIWLRVGPLPEPPKPTVPVAKNPSRLESVMQGYGKGRGGEFCDELLETPKGARLTRRTEWFGSVTAAREAIRDKARDAELLDRESACGAQHDRTRERSAFREKERAGKEPWFDVTWRDGKTVYTIYAHSLDDALDLEREIFSCGPSPGVARPTPRP